MNNRYAKNMLGLPPPPHTLLPWLTYEHSLTEKLKDLTGSAVLRLIQQRWSSSGWWEYYELRLMAQKIFLREIIISSKEKPCWYARTIIPEETFLANEGLFQRLNKESLGEIIFNNKNIVCLSRRYYPINKHCIEYYWLDSGLIKEGRKLWTRLSHFSLSSQHFFYLIEVFLTDFYEVNHGISVDGVLSFNALS